MTMDGDKAEIAFFDVETTVPTRQGQGHAILEFGAILVCPRKLIELEDYSTLVRPHDLSLISSLSVRCNGITKDAVVSAPTFAEIADRVYDILHGRIWAGHNILRFDCPRIREAFTEINRPPPQPKGTLDSLALLTQKFGRRAGDMKMASLATYFGLGQQTHRSLDDVRMNLEVLKYCATVLFLESSLPDIFTENSWISPNAITRSRRNGQTSREGSTPSPSSKDENFPMMEKVHPILEFVTPSTSEEVPDQVESNSTRRDPFDMNPLNDELGSESILSTDTMEAETVEEEETSDSSSRESSPDSTSEGTTSSAYFLEPDKVFRPSISANLVPFFRGTQKIQILHDGVPLQLWCRCLKVRFGVSSKFLNYAGRPRLSFVVNAPQNVCRILDEIDGLAHKLSVDSGSTSEWRPIVIRKPGYVNNPTLRLHLPTISDGSLIRGVTEIYQEESSRLQRLVLSRFDATELEPLLTPGTLVDAYFSLDPYDYQQNAGIRLVAKKLILHSN